MLRYLQHLKYDVKTSVTFTGAKFQGQAVLRGFVAKFHNERRCCISGRD